MTTTQLVAVVLAAAGAVLFGLAAVRQHAAVQEHAAVQATVTGRRPSWTVRTLVELVGRPGWLLGAGQALVGGALHVAALALAPITLVQPLGVIAVPVTVVASALGARRRPSTTEVLGAVLSVAGVAALTLLLLARAVQPVSLPGWPLLASTVLGAVLLTVVVTVTRTIGPPLLRCVALAAAAALLFGIGSILIRLLGHVISTGALASVWPVVLTAALGLALALPVGLWAMQTAYLAGSPHVVICCLTLVDPISAVIGGHLLLGDGTSVGGWVLLGAVGCALVAALGVLLLSITYPEGQPAAAAAQDCGSTSASSR